MTDSSEILQQLGPTTSGEEVLATLVRWTRAVLEDQDDDYDRARPAAAQRLLSLGLAADTDAAAQLLMRAFEDLRELATREALDGRRREAEALLIGRRFTALPDGGWRGNCPLDGTHRNSVRITFDADGLYVECDHGCDHRKIRAALVRDLPALTRLSDVAPEPVRWLWKGRIPFGKLTVIDGRPGLGKSTISLDIGARITTGRPLPGETEAHPRGVVLVVACEDGIADTVRPRFDAAGGDPTQLHILTSYRDENGKERSFRLPEATVALEKAIRHCKATLVILDPLSAYLTGDTHRDAEVRQALLPLAQVAERTGAAMVAIRHLRKAPGPAIYSGGGAVAIIATARSGLIVTEDPEDENLRILASVKSNLSSRPKAWRYALPAESETTPARIDWREQCDVDPDELLSQDKPPPERGKVGEAMTWLTKALADGPVQVAALFDQARENGISKGALQRALLRAETEAFRGPGAVTRWYRRLKGDKRAPAGQSSSPGQDDPRQAREPEAA